MGSGGEVGPVGEVGDGDEEGLVLGWWCWGGWRVEIAVGNRDHRGQK